VGAKELTFIKGTETLRREGTDSRGTKGEGREHSQTIGVIE